MGIRFRILGLTLTAVVMACAETRTTGHPVPEPEAVPPPQVSFDLPLMDLPPAKLLAAQPCLVGTKHCTDLSPEPFKPCLLATDRCEREGFVLQPLEPATIRRDSRVASEPDPPRD